jgi:hypothetical protein
VVGALDRLATRDLTARAALSRGNELGRLGDALDRTVVRNGIVVQTTAVNCADHLRI